MNNGTREALAGDLMNYFASKGAATMRGERRALELFGTHGLAELDRLVRRHSASSGIVDLLCGTHPSYRPSIQTEPSVVHPRRKVSEAIDCAERTRIADAYDALAKALNDERRAYRC